jgi:uncharacterized protein (DUF305 family)
MNRPILLMLTIGSLCAATHPAANTPEDAFIQEADEARTKMTAGMDIQPSGDIDRDFVALMEAHHQGAIALAQAEVKLGTNPRVRRIARGIIRDQGRGMSQMRAALATSPSHARDQSASLPPSPQDPIADEISQSLARE